MEWLRCGGAAVEQTDRSGDVPVGTKGDSADSASALGYHVGLDTMVDGKTVSDWDIITGWDSCGCVFVYTRAAWAFHGLHGRK
jgi:hypothetical protein